MINNISKLAATASRSFPSEKIEISMHSHKIN